MGVRPVAGVKGTYHHDTWATFIGFFFNEHADFEGDNHITESLFLLDEPLLAVEIADNAWFDVIIGRDVLTKFDFSIKRGGRWELVLE